MVCEIEGESDKWRVRRVAADIFDDKCIAVSAKGNISTLPDYLWLRRHTWSVRY